MQRQFRTTSDTPPDILLLVYISLSELVGLPDAKSAPSMVLQVDLCRRTRNRFATRKGGPEEVLPHNHLSVAPARSSPAGLTGLEVRSTWQYRSTLLAPH